MAENIDERGAGEGGVSPDDLIMEALLKALIETGGKLDLRLFLEDASTFVAPDQMDQLTRRAEQVLELYARLRPKGRPEKKPINAPGDDFAD